MGDMRYEPGNWGDVLKGLWVEAVTRHLKLSTRSLPRICDGFAGHPVYPLTAGTRQRLGELDAHNCYVQAQERYAEGDQLASAATLARDVLRHHSGRTTIPDVAVFDLDAHKRDHYAQHEGFRVLELETGFDILDLADDHELLVLDPYEFLWEYAKYLPRLLAAAERTSVLIYLFNKAPQRGGYRRNYTNFLNELDAGRPEGDYLLGRVPSDGFLPQIYHEMLYLPARGQVPPIGLGTELRERTQELAEHIELAHRHLRGAL